MLKDNSEYIELRLKNYEEKYAGLFKFFEESLQNFYEDEELKDNQEIYLNIDNLKGSKKMLEKSISLQPDLNPDQIIKFLEIMSPTILDIGSNSHGTRVIQHIINYLKCIKNKHERQKFESKDAYLLSHKLYCGECENMMTGASAKVNKKKNTCYRYYKCSKGKENVHYCNKTVNKYDIEDAVIELLVEFIWNNSKVSNYVEDIVNYFAKETPDSKSIEKLLKETDRKIANVADAIADGADRSLLVPKLNELKSLRERQVAELREINRNSDIIPKEYIESFLNGLKIKDYLSLENKRYLINTFVSRIYIYDNKHIDIFLNHRGWNTEESVISKAYNEVRLTNRSVHQ